MIAGLALGLLLGTSVHIEEPGVGLDHLVVRYVPTSDEINPEQGEIVWVDGSGRVPPGEEGMAVVAAHVTYNGEPDVFADLHRLAEGDTFEVDGRRWLVRSSTSLTKDELTRAQAVWGEHPDYPALALITCDPQGGWTWRGHARENLVLIATLGEGEK